MIFYLPSEFTPKARKTQPTESTQSQDTVPTSEMLKILAKMSFKGKTSTKIKTKNLIMLPKGNEVSRDSIVLRW